MSENSAFDAALITAFVDARYEIFQHARAWSLSPGRSAEGPACVRALNQWCVITSHNPYGRRKGASENRRAARALTRALLDHRANNRPNNRPPVLLPTCNRDPDNQWPDEPGWLFNYMSPGQVHALATRFEQRAVLCGGHSKPTELWVYTEQKIPKTMQNAIEKQFETVRIVNS